MNIGKTIKIDYGNKQRNMQIKPEMKLIKKGNVYRRVSWLKEHEYEIYSVLCVITGLAVFILAYILH